MTAGALAWLIGASLLSGLVYGFAGFGAALIFIPLAVRVVPPESAVALMAINATGSLVTVVPQALREADRRAAFTMLGAALAALPLGVLVLRVADAETLRWAISSLVLATLALLLSGWHYRGRPGLPAWLGVGALAGFSGGATGLNGPPLVLFQLGGTDSVARNRANTIVVLSLSGFALLPLLALSGTIGMAEVRPGWSCCPSMPSRSGREGAFLRPAAPGSIARRPSAWWGPRGWRACRSGPSLSGPRAPRPSGPHRPESGRFVLRAKGRSACRWR